MKEMKKGGNRESESERAQHTKGENSSQPSQGDIWRTAEPYICSLYSIDNIFFQMKILKVDY